MKQLKDLFIKIDFGNKTDNLKAALYYLKSGYTIYKDDKCYKCDNGYIINPHCCRKIVQQNRNLIAWQSYGSSANSCDLKGLRFILGVIFENKDYSFYLKKEKK